VLTAVVPAGAALVDELTGGEVAGEDSGSERSNTAASTRSCREKLVLRALKSSHALPRRKKRGEYGVGANELTTATSMA
jgi:hypothetical protein